MKKKTLFPFMGLFIIFLLSSCNNDYDVQRDDATSKVDSNFVSLENAKSIATTYEFTNLKTRSKIGKKNIASIYSLKKKSDLPEMYVVNYEGGGFLVISADKRVNEILAYSEDSSFPIDDNVQIPGGVASWMDGYAFLVDSIRKYNVTDFLENYFVADSKLRNSGVGELPLGELGACRKGQSDVRFCQKHGFLLEPYFYYVPGMVHTNWNQGVGFNNLLDDMGCTSYSNRRPPVGCVAVAMAQIMRVFDMPSSFDWKAMPSNEGAYATQVLMKDIGTKVKMDYDCSGSGAYDNDALAAFKQYGYSNAKFINFNTGLYIERIWDQLIKGSPIYVSGARDSNNAHAFVIHGADVTQTFRCVMNNEVDRMFVYPFISEAYYFIHWGWGRSYNGMFLAGNFEPVPGQNYNKNMRFIADFK
ncbi:C10 family peptidase [uncultured Bacteroides sp.]|mgnify:CR=1 FL=1|uniref:C10 family peptidase n=1 Tax=uncultured Bacteroides sp. TaxID=162156 RepID=UPI0025CD3945|nr:C10 family peptidase [uncultured Bacteroides sp.]